MYRNQEKSRFLNHIFILFAVEFAMPVLSFGTFAHVPTFFYAASSGGPLGELVQWTDLISTVFLLGHALTVSAFTEHLPE